MAAAVASKCVLITGDRNFPVTSSAIKTIVSQCKTLGLTIVHGACPTGADSIASKLCDELKVPQKKYPHSLWLGPRTRHPIADRWDKYDNAAGPIRNQQMIDNEKPVICYAFHDNISLSKGTKDTINRVLKAKIVIFLIKSDGTITSIKDPL